MAKIPSTATGKVTEINFGDDEIIPVGHVILTIDEEGDSSSAEASEPAKAEQAQVEAAPTRVATQN